MLIAWIALAAMAAHAADAPNAQYRRADGLSVYYGVVPGEMIVGHERDHAGGKKEKGAHHVLVAIFDARTGARVTDAVVSASVAEPGLNAEIRRLDPMPVAGAMSYGNFFRMPGKGPYRITVKISRPGAAQPVDVSFEYRHP
ncbi:MAG: hypothetical protein HYU77_15635 [Betaproteobacteria bacterium]|nr:hypothetical protein [Betaproteobacteria bacterium]